MVNDFTTSGRVEGKGGKREKPVSKIEQEVVGEGRVACC